MSSNKNPLSNIVFHMKTGFVYRLTKIETSLDRFESGYGVEYSEAKRIGDGKPLRMASKYLNTNYEMLIEEETSALYDFLSENKNLKNLPVKYKNGVFLFGHETEKWQMPHINNSLLDEFEKLISQGQSNPKVESLSIGSLFEPDDNCTLDKIVLNQVVKDSLEQGIIKLKYQDFLINKWNLKSIDSVSKNILNFYGKPGTGKTLCAKAVAKMLNQKLLHVDYSQVESKWVGETGKNIQKVFSLAREHNAVILLDEADSLVSQRGTDSGTPSYVNTNRNIFMQELDKFQGTVILTTNLFQNYDEALLRRISSHIEFLLPDTDQRESLFSLHIPHEVKIKNVDLIALAQATQGFSGGDIKNVCMEAMVGAVLIGHKNNNVEESVLTQELLLAEIQKVKTSKNIHKGKTMGQIGLKS